MNSRWKLRGMAVGGMLLLTGCGHDYKFYVTEGDNLKDKAKWTEAGQNYELALKEARKEKSKHPLMIVFLRQAELKRSETKLDEALALLDKAADVADKIPDEGVTDKAGIYGQIATIYMAKDQPGEAIDKLKEAVRILTEQGKENSKEAAEAYGLLGTICSQEKQYKVADKYFRKAVAIHQEINIDPDGLSRVLYALANNCRMIGMDDDAVTFEESARKMSVVGLKDAVRKPIKKFNY